LSEVFYLITLSEHEAMAELPWIQRCLYLELRRHMNRVTGRVGDSRGISLQGLAEWLYVPPVRGRHASESGSPTKKAVRSALDGLERAGLVRPCGNGEVLVFFLPLAKRVSARSKDEGHVRGTDDGRDDKTPKTMTAQRKTTHERHDEGHTESADEGHTSEVGVNHPYTKAVAAAVTGVVDNFLLLLSMPLDAAKVAEWIRVRERQRGCRARVVTSDVQKTDWIGCGVTGEQLGEAYDLAVIDREVTKNPAPINVPFLSIFVRRVLNAKAVCRGGSGQRVLHWSSSDEGIAAKAAELGVERRPGESSVELRGRVEYAQLLHEDAAKQARRSRAKEVVHG
jgi:hypothetical protein